LPCRRCDGVVSSACVQSRLSTVVGSGPTARASLVPGPVNVHCTRSDNVASLPQLGKGNARLATPSLFGAIVIPCANPPVPVASLLPAEPVVTTRRSSVPTRSYVALAQVTSPSDGLPDPSSSLLSRAIRLVLCPHLAGVKKRRNGAPTNLGSRVQIDGATSYRKHHRRQERVQPRQAAKTLHATGVVSPTSLVNLAPPRRVETDRNTEQTDQTPVAKREPTISRSRCRT